MLELVCNLLSPYREKAKRLAYSNQNSSFKLGAGAKISRKKAERPSKSESNNQQKHMLLQKHPERQQQCILNYIKLKGTWYLFVCVSAVSCLLLHISEQCMWQFMVSRIKDDLVHYGQCNTLNSIRSNVHRVTKFLRFN